MAEPGPSADPDGARRAAIVLSILGEEVGAEVLRHLDPAEIRHVTTAMAELGTLSQGTTAEAVGAFLLSAEQAGLEVGGWEQIERLLRRALPDGTVDTLLQDVGRRPGADIWSKLPAVDRPAFVAFLRGEHPQTVAFVLSRLGPEVAAAILQKLERGLAVDVITRMLQLQPVPPEMQLAVEEALRAEFLSVAATARKPNAHASVAEVFNYLSTESEAALMSGLRGRDEEAAGRVKSLMFTFKDLVRLDAAAVQTLLQAMDKELLPKALAGGDEPVAELFLGNMSQRAAQRMRADMTDMPKPSVKDMEAAQTAILKAARALMDKGDIRLPGLGGGEEDE